MPPVLTFRDQTTYKYVTQPQETKTKADTEPVISSNALGSPAGAKPGVISAAGGRDSRPRLISARTRAAPGRGPPPVSAHDISR